MGKPRMGRPPRASKLSSETVKLRVTPAERRAWERRATRAGLTLSEWLRTAADRALESP